MNLTKIALKRPVSAIIIVCALVIFGLASVFTSPLELTPDIEMPVLMVLTTYPGAGPEDVEDLVTKKIEDQVSTLSGLKTLQSASQENVSMVMLQLEYGSNLDVAHMDLQEKINIVKTMLPDTASDPVIVEFSMEMMPNIILSASPTGDIDLLGYIEDEVVPEFEKLGGVASVDIFGGQEKYVSVQLMEDRLRQYGLDMSTIVGVLASADFSMPGGSADMGSQSLSVRAGVEYNTVEALLDIPITLRSGDAIHLSDVAQVFRTTKEATSLSRYNGQNNVGLQVKKRQSASTLDVAKAVKREVDAINASDVGIQLAVVYDSSDQIVDAVRSVFTTLISGVILSMLVLFLFFGDIKASLIVGSSMPVSLLVTLILMKGMGFSLNLVSLGGLVIAVGMMVDNSIVVLESCFRRSVTDRQDFKTCALEGAGFVSASIVASTITTVVVFLPISMMEGMSGQLFKQLGFTIIFSLTASLICALTLVPLFFSIFKPQERRQSLVSRALRRIESAYGRLLTHILPHKFLVVLIAVALLVSSGFIAMLLNVELMPSIDEGAVQMSIETRPGLQLERVDEILTEVERLAAEHPDVDRYSLSSSGMMGSGSASVTAYLKDDREMSTTEVVEQWRKATAGMLDCEVDVSASSSGMGSMGSSGDVQIALQGNDFDRLREASPLVEEMMYQVEGVVRVSSTISKGDPQAKVQIDPIRAAAKGFQPAQVAQVINMTLSGKEAFTLNEGGTQYDVDVEYPRDRYRTINDLAGLTLLNPAGHQIPLLDIADIEFSDSPQSISRKNNQYIVTITAQTTDAARFTAKTAINERMKTLELPQGVALAQDADTEQLVEELTSLLTAIITAILLVFMVMAMQFESPKFSTMVMLSVPFSLIGSFGMLFITNSTISMTSMMGFLTLVGTVVNNGILFVDTTNQYRASMDMQTALITAGRTRLRPILMTTLTTVLSMVPMALGLGSGGKMMQGMAVVIIGGLCASTLLTLLLLPTFYLIFEGKKGRKMPQPPQPPRLDDSQPVQGLDY
ncbi:MAG: efflux RND transporter permease subunit [Anaerotruncus sp.]|nr:efflux RND transporter permease subunit [Anaerotruncus sp.]